MYWTNFGDSAIRVAPLAGGGNVDTLYVQATGALAPRGMAVNAAAGRIYWANYGGGSLRSAPLAGGPVDTLQGPGPVVRVPNGLAIDPVAGRIYWSNEAEDTIRRAPLTGGGNADVLYLGPTPVKSPGGLAIDRVAGLIYWGNGDNSIRRAPLAGGGSVDVLYGAADGVNSPMGVAIDPAAGRIYWANYLGNSILGAPLAGGGPVDTLYGPADGVSGPLGLAVDPTVLVRIVQARRDVNSSRLEVWKGTVGGWIMNGLDRLGLIRRTYVGRIYWANRGDESIRGAPLAGGGIVDTLYSGWGRGVNGPCYLALLRAPVATAVPAVSGSGHIGQSLHCSTGGWATDLLGSFLSRAPQRYTYQWTLDGADINGATLAYYTPTAAGTHACVVSATNQAGSTAQMSTRIAVS